MDNLRGQFPDHDGPADEYDLVDDETGHEPPPAVIGQDERRMQVRAYNFWASLLGDHNFPSIEDLEPEALHDFGPYSVLLDFSSGIENPAIRYLGSAIARECDAGQEIEHLDDVPSRSLLSRITDHYMQILANQAPIGFEAEFVNQRDATILYRGILLPFSSDDDTIDFIYGVINWKELADQQTTDELLLEIDQALETAPAYTRADGPLGEWADGPVDAGFDDSDEDEEDGDDDILDLTVPFEENGFDEADTCDEDEYEDEEDYEDSEDIAGPGFGSLTAMSTGRAPKHNPLDLGEPLGFDDTAPAAVPIAYEPADWPDAPEPFEFEDQVEAVGDEAAAPYFVPEPENTDAFAEASQPIDAFISEYGDDSAEAAIDPEAMGLADWLASARELAQVARTSEDRSRKALYDAIGRAYDFALAADTDPEEYLELVADAGLVMQERAPLTPLVKLVFGIDYDKTRLTEYATAIGHAQRLGLERGGFADYLAGADGGLKGVVAAERRLRREESGKSAPAPRTAPRAGIARKLRKIEPAALDTVSPEGSEFALLVARRMPDGRVVLLGEVSDDVALVERAARKLIG
jgi:hypothetical protein